MSSTNVVRCTPFLLLLFCASCSSEYEKSNNSIDKISVENVFLNAHSLIQSVKGVKTVHGRFRHHIYPVTNSLSVFGGADVLTNAVSFTTGGLGSFRTGITIVVRGNPSAIHIPDGSRIYYWSMRNTGENIQVRNIYPTPTLP